MERDPDLLTLALEFPLPLLHEYRSDDAGDVGFVQGGVGSGVGKKWKKLGSRSSSRLELELVLELGRDREAA
ncbi:hypothetical protein IAT40_000506 [Kwoniella sp. CBS 6097]